MGKYIFNGFTLVDNQLFGIQRNTIELLKELDRITDAGEIELVIPPSEKFANSFKNIKITKVGKPIAGSKFRKKTMTWLWKNFYYTAYIRRHTGVTIDSILCFAKPSANIVFIYDCIPNMFPENYITQKQKKARKKLLRRQKVAIENCNLLITDSKHSKTDIERIYKPKCEIDVIYCGWQHYLDVREDDTVLSRFNLIPQHYYFSLGSRLPHKNSKWIVSAAQNNKNDTFVITGSNLSNDKSEEMIGTDRNIIYTGYLTDGEIKCLMRNCKAFIQPSIYEGFGIPPMEAMSVGAKCIVSNVSSLPEVYKDYVWYINPKDPYIDLGDLLKNRVKDANDLLAMYSWENSAKKLYEVLKAYGKRDSV